MPRICWQNIFICGKPLWYGKAIETSPSSSEPRGQGNGRRFRHRNGAPSLRLRVRLISEIRHFEVEVRPASNRLGFSVFSVGFPRVRRRIRPFGK